MFHSQRLIIARQPLYIGNQCHQIAQSSIIKVLLRHLVRHYTTKSINNHVDTTRKWGAFFLKKNSTCLSHLLTLALERHAQTNHADNLCAGIVVVCILKSLYGNVGISFIQVVAARQDYSFGLCYNIGVVYGN